MKNKMYIHCCARPVVHQGDEIYVFICDKCIPPYVYAT